jgi:hypothetical protein
MAYAGKMHAITSKVYRKSDKHTIYHKIPPGKLTDCKYLLPWCYYGMGCNLNKGWTALSKTVQWWQCKTNPIWITLKTLTKHGFYQYIQCIDQSELFYSLVIISYCLSNRLVIIQPWQFFFRKPALIKSNYLTRYVQSPPTASIPGRPAPVSPIHSLDIDSYWCSIHNVWVYAK